LDSFEDTVYVVDKEFNLINLNQHGLNMIGKKKEEVIGHKCYQVMHGRDKPISHCPLPGTLKTNGPSETGEYEGKFKKYFSVRISPMTNGNERASEFIGIMKDITPLKEREKAEIRAAKNEERYKKAEGIAHLGSWEMLIQSGKCYWSDEFFRICGYEPGDVEPTAENGFKIIHPDDREKAAKAVEESTSSGKPYRIEKRIVRPSGEVRWVRSEGEIIFNDNREPEKLIGSFLDITEQKNAREELKNSEYRFKNLVETLTYGIEEVDLNGRRIFINSAYHKLLGYQPGELDGTYIWKHEISEKAKNNLKKYLKYLVKKLPKPQPYVSKNKKKDGKVIDVLVNWDYSFDPGGKLKGFTAVVTDITKQQEYERELITAKEQAELQKDEIKLANDRLESLLRVSRLHTSSRQEFLDYALDEAIKLTNSKIGYIYFYDETHQVLSLNTWSKEVLKECSVVNPQTTYNLEKTGCWGEAIRQKKPIIINDYNSPNPHKKGIPPGHVKLHKFLTVPVFIDNKIVAVIGVANKKTDYNTSDVRQLTLLMDTVWKMTERLDLINNLKVAKEKAEESNKLKTEFLNNMSHEIRTPMNGIMGFSDMLTHPGINPDKQKYYSRIIQNSSKQLLKIIDDILEISTLETRQLKLREEVFSLNDLLMDLFSVFNLKSKERKVPIYLKKGLDDKQSRVILDKSKLHKIISNLLENALKFTNEGFIELGYRLDKSKIVIHVKDTGIGISPGNKEKIFERFSQEEKSISKMHGGLGLGLSISKENARLLGGDIALESIKGKGSTFYVTLPYRPEKREKPNKSSKGKTSRYERYTILIAEDDEVNFLYLDAFLKEEAGNDYNILHARDGKEATEVCKQNTFIDMVLMDIKMPVMNGLEATREIKSFRPNLPVIAQTAYSSEPDKQDALKHGCDDYLTKPIDREKLFRVIKKYIFKDSK
jgi:PAS domain S-box-containing protein